MTKNEKLDRLTNISNELDELRRVIESEDSSVWPQYGDKYYSLSIDGTVNKYPDIWRNNEVDIALAAVGNVFKTLDEARFASERLKVLAEIKKIYMRVSKRSHRSTMDY